MNNKLDLLSLSNNFIVTKDPKDRKYKIESVNDNLAASIDEQGKITYYVTGCYDSGLDWLSFDKKEFEKLKEFCELMVKPF